MRPALPNPMNARRHGLAHADARPGAETIAGEAPAFRFDVRRSLRMHSKLADGVAGAVFLLLVFYALSRKPVYTAQSLIYVEPLEVRVLSDGSSSGYDPSRYDSYLQQQVQTVERPDTLEAALAKLPRGMWSAPGSDPAAAVAQLQGALKVERVLNSYQLGIEVKAGSAEAAAASANAVTAAYLEEGRKDEHTRADQRLQLLTEERQRITDDMTRDKAEQASLGTSLGVANPNGASGNPYDLQSEGLRSQLAAAREAHDTVAAQLSSVSGANSNGLDTAANEVITADPGLVSIRQTLSQRRAVLSDQMAGLTPSNPVYKQDQEEIAALDRSMDRATDEARQRAERQLQDKLRLDLRRTADVEGRLNAQLAEQTARATGAGPKLQRAAELDTDLQRLSARYATVDDAIRGLQLETSGPGQAHLVLAARVPDASDPSRRKLILLLALPLAMLCGLAAAVIARRRDPRLYLPGDLQEVLGFAPMCVLPKTGEVSGAVYDDFLLRLAGGLEGAYRHGGARSFVFTPVSVDATTNGLLPKLSAKLRQIGFRAGYMAGEDLMPANGRPIDLMVRTGLHGDEAPAREGVAATQMERFLQDHDMVLIQAPPLLGSALTEYAVRCADATILLVESARTDRTELRRAATLLERLNPQGIGAVLEDMPLQYADSGFRDAVRAADHASRPLPERREPVSSASQMPSAASDTALPVASATRLEDEEAETERAPDADEIAEWEKAPQPNPEAVMEDLPEPAAMFPVPTDVTPAQSYAEEEPATHYGAEESAPEPYAALEDRSAEPVLPSPPWRDAARSGTAGAWSDGDLITFTEAAEFSGRKDSRKEASAPRVVELSYSSAAPEEDSEEHLDAVPVLAVPSVSTEENRAKPVHGWSAWQHVDETTDADVSALPDALPPTTYDQAVQPSEAVSTWPLSEPLPEASSFDSEAAVTSPVSERDSFLEAQYASSDTSPEEPARAEESKPASWWRRLVKLTEDEPALHITPGEERHEDEAYGLSASSRGLTDATSASAPNFTADSAADFAAISMPIEEAVLPRAELVDASAEASIYDADAEALEFAEPAVPVEPATDWEDVQQSAPQGGVAAEAFVEADEVVAFEPWLRTHAATAPTPVTTSYESVAALPAPHEAPHSYADLYEEDARSTTLAQETWQRTEESIAMEPVSFDEPASARPDAASSELDRQRTFPPRDEAGASSHRESQPYTTHLTEEHVAADRKGPLGTFPRPRTSPITLSAVPARGTSVVPSMLSERQEQHDEAAHGPRPTRPATSRVPAPEPDAVQAPPANALPMCRAGLARAAAQVSVEDGPPARASEGLTAMRTGAGLRKALVRGEAALRSHTSWVEPAAAQGEPGMSRRWAMLSRFERADSDARSPEEKAQDSVRMVAADSHSDVAGNSGV